MVGPAVRVAVVALRRCARGLSGHISLRFASRVALVVAPGVALGVALGITRGTTRGCAMRLARSIARSVALRVPSCARRWPTPHRVERWLGIAPGAIGLCLGQRRPSAHAHACAACRATRIGASSRRGVLWVQFQRAHAASSQISSMRCDAVQRPSGTRGAVGGLSAQRRKVDQRPRQNIASSSRSVTCRQVGRPWLHWSARSVRSMSRSSAFISSCVNRRLARTAP